MSMVYPIPKYTAGDTITEPPCPVCFMITGQPCISMRTYLPLKNPHPERSERVIRYLRNVVNELLRDSADKDE